MNLSPIDRDMLIRTVIGEAGKEPLQGQAGVVSVILNRLASGKHGGDVQDVVFEKNQFEPWSTRRSELLSYKSGSESYQRAASVVDGVLNDQIKDPTGGATHFLNPAVVRQRRGGSLPDWAQGEGTQIGQHTFFAPEGRIERVSDTGAAPVTDPAVLSAFGATDGKAKAAKPAAASPSAQPVTDPTILQQFNTATPSPPIMSGVSGVDATLSTPTLPGREIGIGGAFLQGFTSNDQEALRALAQSLYPNEPIDKAVSRFGQEGGVLYHTGDDGKRYRALPEGWSLQDVMNNLAAGVGKAIPAAAGGAVGIATAPAALAGPGGLAASISATGTAGGAGEYAREKIGDYLLGDASTGDVSPWQVAGEAGSSIVGQGAGAGMGALRTRGAVRDIAQYDEAATQQAYTQARQQGINLTPAEATGLPTLAAQQKRLANITPTANEMRSFLTNRDAQVRTAWQTMLDNVSRRTDAEDVGLLGRGAAQNVLENMRQQNLAAARPLYQAAFQQGDREIWSPTLERLTGSPSVVQAMRGAVRVWRDRAIADGFGAMNPGAIVDAGQLRFTGRNLPAFPNLQLWDYTKRVLDDQVRVAQRAGQREKARTLGDLTRSLRTELDRLTNDGEVPAAYAQARQVYGTGAENVQTAMQSALGIIAETADPKVMDAAKQVFNPRTRSPQMVTRLRNAIEGQDPAAWQALKRMYMQDVTTDAMRTAETGEVLNPAGKIHKAFMDERLQENLRAAMTPEEWGRMTDLLVVLRRAASVPALRSDTEFNRLMTKEAENAARPLLAKVAGGALTAANPFQWRNAIDSFLTNRAMDRNAEAVVQLVTSGDPQALATMRELRRLSPWDRRWTILFGHLLAKSSFAGAESLLPQPDFQPSGAVGGGAY